MNAKKYRLNFGLKEFLGPMEVNTDKSIGEILKKSQMLFDPEVEYSRLKKENNLKEDFTMEQFSTTVNKLDSKEQDLFKIRTVELDTSNELSEVKKLLEESPEIDFVAIDELNELYFTPNDPKFPELYGLKKIKAPKAWKKAKGEEIVIAVLDTGVNYNHPDIRKNMWRGPRGVFGHDFSDNDSNPMDYHGHGSHVAGTISAVLNNSKGIVGVAPESKIMALKIFPNAYDSVISKALIYAVNNGAKIINNSWGPRTRRPSAPILERAIRYAHSKNVICVFAAGNNNDNVKHYSPANMKETITVGASTKKDSRADFSNYGRQVDVAAPGVDILSLRHNNSGYIKLSGTSMAAPHVSGAIALLLEHKPRIRRTQVKSILRSRVDKICTDRPIGTGRINAEFLVRS